MCAILLCKGIGLLAGFAVTQDVVGAVIGILIGFVFDFYLDEIEKPMRERDEWETEFSYLFIILHAKFAKMDGRVTPEEINLFQGVSSISKQDASAVRALYNLHRKSSDGFENVAVRMAEMMAFDVKKLLPVVESLCIVMYGAGQGNDLYQKAFIQAVSRIFSISDDVLNELMLEVKVLVKRQRSYGSSGAGAESSYSSNDSRWGASDASYKMLGLSSKATFEEIRTAYKKAIRQHHPDKVRGSGGSEKDIKRAEAKLAEINEAYVDLTSKLDG